MYLRTYYLINLTYKAWSTMSSSSSGWDCKSKILTNHNQLFFLHSTVISQFLTLTASSTTATAHCRPRITLA